MVGDAVAPGALVVVKGLVVTRDAVVEVVFVLVAIAVVEGGFVVVVFVVLHVFMSLDCFLPLWVPFEKICYSQFQ